MRNGTRVAPPGGIDAARARLARDLDALPAAARAVRDPVAPAVRVSDALTALAGQVADEIRRAHARPDGR
jgi:nicotinate phosphoribosyltransferase